MDYILFCSFISLNYTYVNVFELVSDASYNTKTPPSLIQLYCSFLFLATRLLFWVLSIEKGPVWKICKTCWEGEGNQNVL